MTESDAISKEAVRGFQLQAQRLIQQQWTRFVRCLPEPRPVEPSSD